jgi:CheY-like chemotaxis protein
MKESAHVDATIQEACILIVDDQEANVRLLERILGYAGYTRLTSTTDSRLAAALFAEKEPDLVLLDLAMPGLDGFGVIEQSRCRPAPAPRRSQTGAAIHDAANRRRARRPDNRCSGNQGYDPTV